MSRAPLWAPLWPPMAPYGPPTVPSLQALQGSTGPLDPFTAGVDTPCNLKTLLPSGRTLPL